MRETHASSSIHVHDVKFIKCLNYYTSACLSILGENKEFSFVFSMKLSNANPIITWMDAILTQEWSVERSCIICLFYLFILFIFCTCLFFLITLSLISMIKEIWLSNANSVSAWIGERLTLPGAVAFSCIFFLFFFFLCLLLFSLFFIPSNNSVCICSADALSYDMSFLYMGR